MQESKVLLRGMFVDGSTAEHVIPNVNRLIEAVETGRYSFADPGQHRIYTWARDFFREHHGPPAIDNLRHYNERLPDEHNLIITELADDITAAKLTTHSTYSGILGVEVEAYRRNKARLILGDGQDIVEKGRKNDKGPRLEGIDDAHRYVVEHLGALLEAPGRPSRSDVWQEGQQVVEEYMAAKGRPPGLLSGLGPIDACFSGVRPGEMWTHAAFTGQLKTTLALNWSYHATAQLGSNVLYVSLEMPAEQIRRLSYALHSANPKFGRGGLDYGAIKDGRLPAEEEAHLAVVAADAATNRGKLVVWSPAVTPTIQEIGSKAEQIDQEGPRGLKRPIGLIVIDHSGLVKPASKDRDYYTRMNSVFTDAKRLAMGFARGRGVPVLMLHQLNREGFREAAKGKAITLVHLSSTNEAERSSDYITYSWVDAERRARSRVQIGALKNREGALFDAFEAAVNFPSRRVSAEEAFPDAFDDDLELDV